MKKFWCVLLATAMILTLAACSGKKQNPDTKGMDDVVAPENMTAAELAAYAAEQKEKVTSYRFCAEVTVQVGETSEKKSITESYVKKSYDAYDFSYTEKNAAGEPLYVLSFADGTAFLWRGERTFRAPTTTLRFASLREEYVPYSLFYNWSALFEPEKDGLTLRFSSEETDAAILGTLFGEGECRSVTGAQSLGTDGFFERETIVLSGVLNGEKKEVRLESRVEALRSSQIECETVPEETEVVEISDLQLPDMAENALARLLDSEELDVTLSHDFAFGELQESYVMGIAKKGADFLIEENGGRKENAEAEWVYTTYFLQGQGNTLTSVTYLLSGDGEQPEPEEREVSAVEKDEALRQAVLPFFAALTDYSSMQMTETTDSYEISFEVSNEAVLSMAVFALPDPSVVGKSGTLMIDKKTGALSSLAYTYEVASGGNTASFRISLVVNAAENVTLGTITEPAPIGNDVHG